MHCATFFPILVVLTSMKDGLRNPKKEDKKPPNVDWKKRLLTAAVAIPTLLTLISLDTRIWTAFILAMIGVGYREFSNLISYEMKIIYPIIPLIYYSGISSVCVFGVTLILLFVPLVDLGPSIGMRNGVLGVFFLNMFAIPIMFGAKIHSDLANGPLLTLLWILISFASDAGALIVGSRWGKRPLCPSISPKKTWEGVIGGFIGGLGSGVFFFILIGLLVEDKKAHMTITDFLVIGFMEAFLGVIGDLIESGFKRFVSAKDASSLLPGHGGMLDRMDALAAAAPFLYAYCIYRNL